MNCGTARMSTSSSTQSILSSTPTNMVCLGTGMQPSVVAPLANRSNPCYGDKLPLQPAPSNMGPHRDDGSSGYGSPDSETFESPQAQ